MSAVVIKDFKLGMDRRSERIAGQIGALWDGINGHINRGGHFERRKKFVKKYALPAGNTFGMAQLNKQLYTFGSAGSPGTIPAGVSYQQLVPGDGSNMVGVLDVNSFGGSLYAVAQFDNGAIYHFYNGARVTTWDTVANSISSNGAIASTLANNLSLDPRYLATAVGSVITIIAAIAGTGFTISQAATGGTLTLAALQANVVAVAETPAAFSMTIQGGTPSNDTSNPNQNAIQTLHDTNSISLIGAPIPWIVSNDFTAQAVSNAINNYASAQALLGIIGYTATFSGAVVTISAPAGQGSTPNGLHLDSRTTGNFSWLSPNGTITNTGASEVDCGAFAGGVNAVAAVAQVETVTVGGAYGATNTYNLTVDSVAYKLTGLAAGMGITCFPYNQRLWSVAQSLLNYCSLADATIWTGGTSGFINMSTQDSSNDPLVGINQYQNRIAVFTRNNTQIWILAVDPSQNTFQQSVQNTGALSNRSIQQYGNIDVFYLDNSGVRSMRARDASNAPAVNDVGVAIDAFLNAYAATLTGKQISRACSVIEPIDGRDWVAMHNRIFVYSFFPGSKISAWTYYDLTDEIGSIDISEMVRSGNRIYLRAGDNIYLYGGDTNAVYPNDNEIVATLGLPYLAGEDPSEIKNIYGFNIGATGSWNAKLLPLPNDSTVKLELGIFTGTTYNMNDNPIQLPTPMFAMELICNTAGYASVSNMTIKFAPE